jgi:hypothetical protein
LLLWHGWCTRWQRRQGPVRQPAVAASGWCARQPAAYRAGQPGQGPETIPGYTGRICPAARRLACLAAWACSRRPLHNRHLNPTTCAHPANMRAARALRTATLLAACMVAGLWASSSLPAWAELVDDASRGAALLLLCVAITQLLAAFAGGGGGGSGDECMPTIPSRAPGDDFAPPLLSLSAVATVPCLLPSSVHPPPASPHWIGRTTVS